MNGRWRPEGSVAVMQNRGSEDVSLYGTETLLLMCAHVPKPALTGRKPAASVKGSQHKMTANERAHKGGGGWGVRMMLTPNTNMPQAVRAPKQYNKCERSLRLGQNMKTHVRTRSTWSSAEEERSSTPKDRRSSGSPLTLQRFVIGTHGSRAELGQAQ